MEPFINAQGNLEFRPRSNTQFGISQFANQPDFMSQFNQPTQPMQEINVESLPAVYNPQADYGQFFRPQPVVDRNLFTPITEKVSSLREGISSLKDKGIDLGKMAIAAATGIPVGILNALPERDYRQTALENFYGNIENGTIQSGLMAGYNPVSGGLLNMLTGGRYGDPTNYGLQRSYQKRIDMIRNNLAINKYKDPDAMRERLEQLEELKRKEAEALEAARIKADKIAADKPSVNRDFGASRRGDSDISDSQRGGFATDDTAGFFKNGGIVNLLWWQKSKKRLKR